MKKKRKKEFLKNLFSDRYTRFQKMWIVILLILICISLLLTVWQIGTLAFRDSSASENEKKAAVSASPSADTDSVVLGETADAGKNYIENTLFLGDSNTVRFMNTTDDEGNTYTTKNNTIAVVGMGVDGIDSLKCMQFSTGTFTMVDSVKILQPQRIIITFGTNNLSGTDSEKSRKSFIDSYEKQLKKISEAYPAAELIINSIPPISDKTVYQNLSAMEILHWNQAIEEMCRQNHWHYLNSFEALADPSTGYALENMMDETDGLHLGDNGLKTLFEYIRTHALNTEDRRQKPLNEIPEIIGCKTEMITTNPLNGSIFNGTEGGSRRPAGNQNTVRQSTPVPQISTPVPVQPVQPQEQAPVQQQTPASVPETENNAAPQSDGENNSEVPAQGETTGETTAGEATAQ